MGINRERAPTRPELIEMYGWWERHRDDFKYGGEKATYASMEFAGMSARLFAYIAKDDIDLSEAFVACNPLSASEDGSQGT